jgi:hypothetical protein
MRGIAAAVATAALLAPVGLWASLAEASETVLGDDTAHACFEASISKRADADAVHLCDVALDGSVMKPADRGGALSTGE